MVLKLGSHLVHRWGMRLEQQTVPPMVTLTGLPMARSMALLMEHSTES